MHYNYNPFAAYMDYANLTQSQLAEICGVSRVFINRLLNREHADVKISTLTRICERTSIDIGDAARFLSAEHREKLSFDLIKSDFEEHA